MYGLWEWSLLFVFLLCILLTGIVSLLLIKRVVKMIKCKRETRVLNELMHIATTENAPEHRLQSLLKTIMQTFPDYQIDDALILQPDSTETLHVQASLSQHAEQVLLSIDEQDIVNWVMTSGYDMSLYQSFPHILSTHSQITHRTIILASLEENVTGHYIRFLPLKAEIKTVGVLRLSIRNEAPFFPYQDGLDVQTQQDRQATFFWKCLNQIALLLEHQLVAEPVSETV